MSVPSLSPLAAALAAKLTPDPEIILAGLDPVPLPSNKAPKAEASKASPDPQAPSKPAPPPPAQVVEAARQAAAGRQSGVAPLMADLEQALRGQALPPPVKAAAAKVLALQTPVEAKITPETVRRAVAQSGLFLEPRLARTAAPPPADLKGALLMLRQVLRAAAPPPSAPPSARPSAPPAATASPLPPASSPPVASTYGPPPTARLPDAELPFAGPAPRPPVSQGRPLGSSAPIAQPAQAAATPQPAAQSPLSAARQPLHPGAPAPQPQGSTSTPTTAGGAGETRAQPPAQPSAAAASRPLPPIGSTPSGAPPPIASATPQAVAQPVDAGAAARPGQAQPPPPPIAPEVETGSRPAPPARPDAARTTPTAAEPPPPPPVKGAPPEAQPAARPSLPAEADPAALIRHLERATGGAIARTELFQMASLPDAPRADGDAATRNPTWLFEVPLGTPQGPAVAQFEIERDGANASTEHEGAVWRTRFSVDVEPLGLIHALLVLAGGKTTVTLWAERTETLERLRLDQADLAGSLEADVAVYPGRPPAPQLPAGRFLDASS